MCPCERGRGYICPSHCQRQGCTDDGQRHTDHCIAGERIAPVDRCWWAGEEPREGLDVYSHLDRLERVGR